MNLLRTIPWFTRLLVGLFLAAQFAGMVSMQPANALPAGAAIAHAHASHTHASANASAATHRGHAQGRSLPCSHHDGGGNPADTCCALHACFAGLLPPAVAISAKAAAGQQLAMTPDDLVHGAPGDRLDRPPRPLH